MGLAVVALGCSGRGSAPVAPPSELAEPAEPAAAAAEVDPASALDDELRRREWLRDHGNEADRARALVELGFGYQRLAGQRTLDRFDLEQARDDAPPERRAELDRQAHALVAESDQWLRRSVAAFETVLDDHSAPALALRSEARLGLAQTLTTLGDDERAEQVLQDLLRDDATSLWAGHAMLTLADAAFARGSMDVAATLYGRTQLVAAPTERLYARYKLGWVAFNLDEPATALSHWMAVVEEGIRAQEHHRLADEAARDCVRAFVQVGQPARARLFFQRLHPRLAPRLLADLAQQYRDQGRPGDAAIVMGQSPPSDPSLPGASPSLGGPVLQ